MITIIQPIDMLNRYGDNEMAQRCTSDSALPISAQQLRTGVLSGDRTTWSSDLRGEVDSAVAKLTAACETANELITGAARSGGLIGTEDTPTKIPQDVKYFALSIARYQLYEDRCPEHIRLNYEDAVSWINKVAQGKISIDLGLDTPRGSGYQVLDITYPLMSSDQWI